MAAIRRGFPKWDTFINVGNTGTLIIMPMGRGIEKAKENSRSTQSYGLKRSSYQGITKLSKVTPAFLESYKLFRAKKASKGTANHDLKVLSIMFN